MYIRVPRQKSALGLCRRAANLGVQEIQVQEPVEEREERIQCRLPGEDSWPVPRVPCCWDVTVQVLRFGSLEGRGRGGVGLRRGGLRHGLRTQPQEVEQGPLPLARGLDQTPLEFTAIASLGQSRWLYTC